MSANGAVVSAETVVVDCDAEQPTVSDTEVAVVNACRFGNGYLLFQFVNETDASRSYVVEFSGVRNRSATAAPHGAAVRAVTGRPDGIYDWAVRVGSTYLASGQVEVAC